MKIRIGKVPSTRIGARIDPRGATQTVVVRVSSKPKSSGPLAWSKCPTCVRVVR